MGIGKLTTIDNCTLLLNRSCTSADTPKAPKEKVWSAFSDKISKPRFVGELLRVD